MWSLILSRLMCRMNLGQGRDSHHSSLRMPPLNPASSAVWVLVPECLSRWRGNRPQGAGNPSRRIPIFTCS